VRIASVARDATFQRMLGGPEFAAGVVRKRAGGAFDPDVATPLADAAGNGSGCTPTIPSASWPALRSWPRWHPWPASTTSGSTARATTEEPPPPSHRARLLAAADAYHAMTERRPHRAPHPTTRAAGGLTEREAEVIGLLARGLQTKQVARRLGISVKTADHHVQNAYAKIGVSTRAAAALFAMEHGLTAWGELPIGRVRDRS